MILNDYCDQICAELNDVFDWDQVAYDLCYADCLEELGIEE